MDSKNSPQIIELMSKSVTFTPYEVRWVPCSARFVVLGIGTKGQGIIKTYTLEGGQIKLLSEVEKKEGIKCGTFGASLYEKRHLATGNYVGELNIW